MPMIGKFRVLDFSMRPTQKGSASTKLDLLLRIEHRQQRDHDYDHIDSYTLTLIGLEQHTCTALMNWFSGKDPPPELSIDH